jgi:hypothetical protein
MLSLSKHWAGFFSSLLERDRVYSGNVAWASDLFRFSFARRAATICRHGERRMGAVRWLILVPYYFLGPLAALPLLMLLCRVVRVKVSINALVGTAIGMTIAAIGVPLVCGWLDLSAFAARPLLLLMIASVLFAALDAALAERLPLPLDKDLRQL